MVITGIKGCVRCGGNHKPLNAKRFRKPHKGYTFWATCPSTKDPILVKVTK